MTDIPTARLGNRQTNAHICHAGAIFMIWNAHLQFENIWKRSYTDDKLPEAVLVINIALKDILGSCG